MTKKISALLESKQLHYLLLLLIVIYFSLFYLQVHDFIVSDLGRHLTNGRIIVETKSIPRTNLYSYTFPGYPTIMHHWGAGVIYYWIHSFFGFSGLTLFTAAIYLTSISICIFLGLRLTSPPAVIASTILALPLIVSRTSIRPESFSYLFLSLELLIIHLVQQKTFPAKFLYLLPLIQLVWINTHIFFFLGLITLAVFYLSSIVHTSCLPLRHPLKNVLFLSLLFSLINPFGFQALLSPFQVLTDTQTQKVLENLNVFSYLSHFEGSDYAQFIVLLFLSLGSIFSWIKHDQVKLRLAPVLLLFLFGFLGVAMVRNIALFGFIFVPYGALILHTYLDQFKPRVQRNLSQAVLFGSVVLLILGSQVQGHYYGVNTKYLGLEMMPGQENAARFIQDHGLPGPIFNNYDIGGYLIYYLYPNIPVFTDNRPEAYPDQFFSEIYFPIQTDEFTWQQAEAAYGFQTVIVSYHDFTNELNSLLTRLQHNNQWQQVYQDDYILIFTKKPILPPQT